MSPKQSIRLIVLVCLAATGCSRDPKVAKEGYLKAGDNYLAEGKGAEASVEYRKAVQVDPQDGNLRLKLAEAYVKSGQGPLGALEFIRAADVLVDRVDVQVKAGSILLLGGRFDDAKVRAEKALAIAPLDVTSQILLANALAGLKDLNAAVAEIEEAIKLEPERAATYTNLGALEISRGRREAAERAFKKATQLDPRSGTAQLALANFYWMDSRLSDAELALTRALELEPENTLVLRAMANFAITRGRADRAELYLKKIVEVTKSADATIALADFYIARQDEATARTLLQPIAEGKADSAPASIRLAALDHAAGQKDRAYARLNDVLSSDKSNTQALLVKSTMLLSDGRPEDALVPAELATQSHPESTAAFFVLGRVQTARNQRDAAIVAYKEALRLNPRAIGAQTALARLHLANNQPAESIVFAQDALNNDPHNADARLTLVRGLLARGDLIQATSEIARLASDYPNAAPVRVQKGILLARKKDTAGARREFDAALELDPNSTEALGGLLALDLAAKQPSTAVARLGDRITRPEAGPALLMLGARTYAATGDFQKTEQTLRRVLEKDASYLPAYSALGQLYLRQRKLDAALTEFAAMAKRDPKPVAALTLSGIILQAQGKTSEARAHFERVLELDPSAPVAANNLAWTYAESGSNLDIALQLAQTAQRGLPESPEVSNTLGFIYYKKGLYALAIPSLKISADKEPTSPVYQYHLGLAYAKSGNAPHAIQALQRALELKPDFSEARLLLDSLKVGLN
jgi:tetratricopeptide (TPR) repeat protein